MNYKTNDWIEHPTFGVGRISENRQDRRDIDFINSGAKTILKTMELKPALPPTSGFNFPHVGNKSRTPRFKVQRPLRRPALDFDHLVASFKRHFPAGFEGQDFHDEERGYKEKAGHALKEKLGKDAFAKLLRGESYAEVCEIAKHILRSTNLAYPIEKAKLSDGVEVGANQKQFADALYDLLYGTADMESRFTTFVDVLAKMDADKWPLATYYQFLATDGQWMFMKPSIMKQMADSLRIALNYKPEPNWLTYVKLQELADRVDTELRNRGLTPHSRMDVQGFIWASIWIEEGKYGAASDTEYPTAANLP